MIFQEHSLTRALNFLGFNMPLEFGIFLGAKFLGTASQKKKVCLVFDEQPYRYQKYLSDVAGQDISHHGNDPKRLIREIRDWLASVSGDPLPSGSVIWDRYQTFRGDLEELCLRVRQKPDELTYADYVRHVTEYRDSKRHSLQIGSDREIIDPHPNQVRAALRKLRWSPDSFVIYSKGGIGLTYLQTRLEKDGSFLVEYQDGSSRNHFFATSTPTRLEVIELFLQYAAGEDAWRTAVEWEHLELD